jgi:hypothetical protein
MRYLEVGGLYKRPLFPIWVVGSSSHFSVVFGDEIVAIQESSSDALLEKVRRTFKGMDGGAQENGFIQTSQLAEFFQKVGLSNLTPDEVQMLSAMMEAYGAGIILWEELWKKTSRLLTGAAVQSVLQDGGGGGDDDGPPPLEPAGSVGGAFAEGVAATARATVDHFLSDEELARKLQAEWNNEVVDWTGANVVAGTIRSGSDAATASVASSLEAMPALEPSDGVDDGGVSLDFGRSFRLYHYNGLRGGTFRPFRVTRLNADEAIGASIPLGSSSHQGVAAMGGGDLEDVLRTKWPSCKIDWQGGAPPSID